MGPRRVLDTKTYWLTDRQSQCDSDFEWHSVNQEVAECSCSEWIGNVKNTDCVISSDSVDREITESSEVQQLRVQLYRVHGRDYRRSICDTADGS
jgi:hypothetical protein